MWSLSTFLLHNLEYNAEIVEKIQQYFEENDTADVFSLTLWNALKPSIRDHLIGMTAHVKNQEISSEKFYWTKSHC